MFRYEKKYYTMMLPPCTSPVETYDEMMVSEDGVCITYKSKGRDLDDTFEYKDQTYTFLFNGDWWDGVYVVNIGAYLGALERSLNIRLPPDYVAAVLYNIEEALKTWPIEGRIYRTARVNIVDPIKDLVFRISNWSSWQSSGLSAQISNWS